MALRVLIMNLPGFKPALCLALVFAFSGLAVALSDGPDRYLTLLVGLMIGTIFGAGVVAGAVGRAERRPHVE